MTAYRNTERWPRALAIILVTGVALAAAAYYYYTQPQSKNAVTPANPNTDFTTAPEGGVKVNLPKTPMTSRPATAAGEGEGEGEGEAAPGTAPALPAPTQTSPAAPAANP